MEGVQMKKIVCEVCGGMNVRKQNGVFVCTDCGIEYSLEEVKKLFVDVEDKPAEPVATEAPVDVEDKLAGPVATEAPVAFAPNNEDIINKLKLTMDYVNFINKKQIMASELFYLGNDEKDMNLLEMDPDSIRKLKTYRTEEIDAEYFFKNGVDSIYKCIAFNDDYEKFKENYGDNSIDAAFLNEIENCLEITPGQYLYKLIFTFKFLSEQKVVEREDIFYEMIEKTIKNTILNYYDVNTLVNYSFSKLAKLIRTKGSKIALKVEKYTKKKGFRGDKIIVESTKECDFSKLILNFIEEKKNTFPPFINSYIKDYADRIEIARENLIELITPYYNLRKFIGPVYDSIPKKYRTEENILCLINLFMENRITTIGEGLNMIDTYQFRTEIKGKLNDIKKSIAELDNKMNVVGSELYNLETGVRGVNQKVDKLVKISRANLVLSICNHLR